MHKSFIIFCSLTLYSSLGFASFFGLKFPPKCRDSFAGISYVHGAITKRDEATLINSIQEFDSTVHRTQPKLTLWHSYSSEEVKSGKRSLLSLGEGESNFIAKAISARKSRNLPYDDLHAVDVAYFSNIAEVDAQFAAKNPFGFRAAEIKNYPNNYHGQRFDVLNLLDSEKKPYLFDEIVSGNGVSYVLRASNAVMQTEIMKRIALHAKSRAILRIWNINSSNSLESQSLTHSLLNLREMKVILDFGYVPNFDIHGQKQEGLYVIFP